jgi:serine/threonine protein phosphatase PrpC
MHTTLHAPPDRSPRDDEIDVYGLTHPGKVRKNNQDHFLICSLRKQMVLRQTSIPHPEHLVRHPERLASLAMVADGVGGAAKGEEASRIALEGVTEYVASSMQCYYSDRSADESEFSKALQHGALQCHTNLLRESEANPEYQGMATTLTLFLGVWPRGYLLQVGDSRCYLLRDDELTQITHDQTMAQELVDMGILPEGKAAASPFAHTLTSSIGGKQTAPVVTRFDMTWGNVLLLCSDGITKHVSDDRIRNRLRSMTSARQACEHLLQDALDDGGSDNITVIVGRATPKQES